MIKVKIKKSLAEGGNVFAGKTDSIPLEYIQPTLDKYYEELDRLFPQHSDKFRNFQPLGSVGKKAKSGDIDLAVNVKEMFPDGEVNPEDIESWGLSPDEWKAKIEKLAKRARTATPTEIGWKAFLQLIAQHINENSDLIEASPKRISAGQMFSLFPQFNEQGDQLDIGVQIDWMVGNLDWLTFSYFSDAPSEDEPLLKGLHRTQLIHALILAKDHSFSHTKGVKDKSTGQIVAFSKEEILDLLSRLYRNTITLDDTQNFNTLYDWLRNTDEEDRNKALRAYLKILDTTRGNKDLNGERCGYIPRVLEQMYLSLLKNGEMTGRFLCKEANPTLWAAKNGSLQESSNNDEKITVVIPGGFKPPHRGHVEMINHFANLPNVDEVIIFTGSKPRESADGSVVVTAEKARKLFNLFDLAPNVSFGNVRQRYKKDGSTYENPFMDAVRLLFNKEFAGKNIAIGHPTKDADYGAKFKKIASYLKGEMTANIVEVPPADTTDNLSATDLRNAVQSNDLEELKRFIPPEIAEAYVKILTGN
jgi:hypothetical protein